jgi:hypothetical protein
MVDDVAVSLAFRPFICAKGVVMFIRAQKKLCGIVLLLVAACTFATPPEIKVPESFRGSAKDDLSYSYFVDLLKEALVEGYGKGKAPIIKFGPQLQQGRTVFELMRGDLVDTYWMGPDDSRAKYVLMIPVPLDKGLLGFRKLIINKKNHGLFDAVRNIEDLARLTACQGLDWPDTDIMRGAGLRVSEVSDFEGIFKQLVAGRCMYFPRGYVEPDMELNARKHLYPELEVYDGLLIHYHYAMHYFVSPKNPELAKVLELGLHKMVASGKLDEFMRRHAYTAHYFPLKKYRIIQIENPYRVETIPETDKRYWISVDEIALP